MRDGKSGPGGIAPAEPKPGRAQQLRRAETWIFDLDNTLYPMSSAIFSQIDKNIRNYVARLLDLHPDDAKHVQKGYLASHGTTLRGLMDNHQVDEEDYLRAVHDIDLSSLKPDTRLSGALAALDGRRLVFTNADLEHSERVIARLGLEGLIDDVFDIRRAEFMPKPEPATYNAFVDWSGVDPLTSVMFEDMARNLVPAAAMGMTTVWLDAGEHLVAPTDESCGHIDYRTDDLAGWLVSRSGLSADGGER